VLRYLQDILLQSLGRWIVGWATAFLKLCFSTRAEVMEEGTGGFFGTFSFGTSLFLGARFSGTTTCFSS